MLIRKIRRSRIARSLLRCKVSKLTLIRTALRARAVRTTSIIVRIRHWLQVWIPLLSRKRGRWSSSILRTTCRIQMCAQRPSLAQICLVLRTRSTNLKKIKPLPQQLRHLRRRGILQRQTCQQLPSQLVRNAVSLQLCKIPPRLRQSTRMVSV